MKKWKHMNPILKKELMVGSRSMKMSFGLLGVNAFLTLIVVLVISATNGASRYTGYNYAQLVCLFPILGCVECGILSLVVPIITSGSISGEREKQTLDIMLTTPVKPFSIALGKLGSAMTVVMMYMISSIPVMAIAFVLGGMSWWSLLGLIGMMLYLGIYVGSVGIFCSSVVKKSIMATILTIVIGIAIITVTFVIFGICNGIATYRATVQGITNYTPGASPLILLWNPYSPFFDFMVRSVTNSSIYSMLNMAGNKSKILGGIYQAWIPISIFLNLLVSLGFLKLAALNISATRNKKKR